MRTSHKRLHCRQAILVYPPLSLCDVHQQYLYERPVHIPHKIACVVLIRFVIPVVFNKLTRVERMYR